MEELEEVVLEEKTTVVEYILLALFVIRELGILYIMFRNLIL